MSEEPTDALETKVVLRLVECQHFRIDVCELEAEVTCRDCNAKLNPIAILARYGREESRLTWAIETSKKEREAVEQRARTKCRKCGEMTVVSRRPFRTSR